MKIRLWLSVVDGSGPVYSMGTLWYRDLETGQAPSPGTDRIILWDDDGDLAGGPLWDVQRRYWDAAGNIHCELVRLVVDPNERVLQSMRDAAARGDYTEQLWETSVDGRPEPKLQAGGWRNR